jgi:hypothetical protein
VLVALLVAGRLALPYYLESYVNRTIDESPDYTGSIGTIDVNLWRGAYTIHDLKILKRTHSVPRPFFEGDKVRLAVDWSSLLHGQVRGKIVMDKPRLNFVQGPSEEETQTGADQPWLGIIDELFPFRIDKAEVRDGEVHFVALHKDPRVDVYLSEVQATLENLTNIENKTDPLLATLNAQAVAMDSGRIEVEMSLDPHSRQPTFQLAARLLEMDARKLNALTMAYAGFDIKAGSFDFVLELSAKDGHVQGYAKPLFRNLRVFSLEDLRTKNPLSALWQAVVGLVGEAFKNQPRDQFGTRLTLEGNLDDPQTSILEVIGNVLRNAFIQAYLPQIEGRVAPGATNGAGSRN